MRTLFIIRGLPGSGKSTLARQIADEVYEADMFFMDGGEYKFDHERIKEAHEWCQGGASGAMSARVSKIAVANTFVKRWEMEPYYNMAFSYGYTVTEITMSGTLYGNVHDVPDEVIERMRTNWER